ncbi:hypothetical protein Tsubulata_029147 [Turnera subulata]|uniref:Uncharacterized protein n=1 Tax=Turnera subulata TaxID=218843 RepID=A0A9Q0GJL9_9ROSI|nr:hypothetical protein Tsubulata_029147 [Turnera subulata]
MSLVDYASSSDDEGDVPEEKAKEEPGPAGAVSGPQLQPRNQLAPYHPPIPENDLSFGSLLNRGPQSSASSQLPAPSPPLEKLPDASFLLNSPSLSLSSIGTDHASRVSAAMAENASRKRDVSGLASSSLSRSKVLKGTLPHTKRVPDTVGGVLVPPQLKGRSNVVTEDIGKLFVKRHSDTSSG